MSLFGRAARNQRCYDQERGKGNDRFHISRANSISLRTQMQIGHDTCAVERELSLSSASLPSGPMKRTNLRLSRFLAYSLSVPKESAISLNTSHSNLSASIGVVTVALESRHDRAQKPHAARQRQAPPLPSQIFLTSSSSRSDSRGNRSIFFQTC